MCMHEHMRGDNNCKSSIIIEIKSYGIGINTYKWSGEDGKINKTSC